MKTYLEVKADTNDGDYVCERTEISEADLERFMPLIKAIKKQRKKGHNWCTSDYGDEPPPEEMYESFGELVDEFSEYVPCGEYGVHTIVSIIKLVAEETVLL